MKPETVLVHMRIVLLIMTCFVAAAQPLHAQGRDAPAQGRRITAIAVDSSGNWVAVAAMGDGEPSSCVVCFFDAREEKLHWEQPIEAKSITAMTFTRNGGLLAVDDQGQQHILSPTARNVLRSTVPPMPGTRIALIDPMDGLLVTIDDQIRLWKDGRVSLSAPTPDLQELLAASFINGGSHLAVATKEHTMLLHPRSLRAMDSIGTHQRRVTSFSSWFGSEGLVMFVGHDNGSVGYWQAGKGVLRRTIPAHPKRVTFVTAYDAGARCASLGDDGFLRFWEAETGRKLAETRVSRSKIDLAATSTDGRVLAIAAGNEVQVRTLDPMQPGQVGRMWMFSIDDPAPEIPPRKIANPNLLRNWKVIRGDWEMQRGHLVGTGDSRIEFKPSLPAEMTLRFKLQLHGETNPRVRFESFHFGYEGRRQTFFLHGPKATGEPFPFELDREYAVEVQIEESGRKATLRIDEKEIAVSQPESLRERRLWIEAGGEQSQGSCEFYDIEIVAAGLEQAGQKGDAREKADPLPDDDESPPTRRRRRPMPRVRETSEESPSTVTAPDFHTAVVPERHVDSDPETAPMLNERQRQVLAYLAESTLEMDATCRFARAYSSVAFR
ncbi:MAG: WD40 repeat domain-containing protein [Planctomycetaceae bacterium]|nr:WD40 repeat domain-containing protein [Planctomycetaceae bacterium]